MAQDIKSSPLWDIWGEIWTIVKAYYPYPESDDRWVKIVDECSKLSKKYENTEYSNLVTNTLIEIMSIYEKRAAEE